MLHSTDVVCTSHHESQAKRVLRGKVDDLGSQRLVAMQATTPTTCFRTRHLIACATLTLTVFSKCTRAMTPSHNQHALNSLRRIPPDAKLTEHHSLLHFQLSCQSFSSPEERLKQKLQRHTRETKKKSRVASFFIHTFHVLLIHSKWRNIAFGFSLLTL